MKNHTDITVILDRSGSMDLVKSATIEGYNKFLQTHKSEGTNVKVSLVKFDHEYDLAYEEKKIKKKYYLNETNYIPRGSTALFDAIGKTIEGVDRRIKKYKVEPKVIIAIITDGYENDSKFYNLREIKKGVKKRINKHNWNFVYLGANQDAIFEGKRLGISSDYSHNFKASKAGVKSAFNTVIKQSMALTKENL
ncbi:VWA domain-containing protein [Flavobacteriaceae bacterium S0862]|nr:VWA domain-containing protein [Flavobacteriaceae bacterium S0862]